MKTIASRQLAARPGQVWKTLDREGALIVTRDGVPRRIMVPTSDATFLEDLQELVFSRARRAVCAIRTDSAKRGLDRLSMAEIDAEMRAARKARKGV